MPLTQVSMLNQVKWKETNSQPNGNSAQAQIDIGPYTTLSALFISAHGESQCSGAATTTGAGIQLAIEVDGSTVSFDECYEGQPGGTMTFQSSAAYHTVLPASKIVKVIARIAPYGGASATNKNTTVTLECIALAIQ